MKLSKDTIAKLKNFSTINQSILFNPGREISTISPQKTVLAYAQIEDEIPSQAGVYDINRLITAISLLDDPEILFEKDKFVIKSGSNEIKYTYAAPNLIVTPPSKGINIDRDSYKGKFHMEWDDLKRAIQSIGILQLRELSIEGNSEGVSISAVDADNPTADKYTKKIKDLECKDPFKILISVDNLKLMGYDYTIYVFDGVALFKNDEIEYWVAGES